MLRRGRNSNQSGLIIEKVMSGSREPLEIVAGVDAGSTQTRVSLADKQDAKVLLSESFTPELLSLLKQECYVIPSTYAVVPDEREILPNSQDLEDNYDSHVIRVSTKAVNPLVGSDRIVRGQKMADSTGLVPRYLDSSSNKMDNTIFYVNVLDAIGYSLLQKYSGNIPYEVRIHLNLSVRPMEMNSKCREKMNDNFIGKFIFRWDTIAINMEVVEASYSTEPEAQIFGTSLILDAESEVTGDSVAQELSEKFYNADSYIHIEGGGSSIGVEVIHQEDILDSCSSTFALGGNYLLRVVKERLRSTTGRSISDDAARGAIYTCLLKNGRAREDVSEVIAACKRQVGQDILERLRHDVLDMAPDLSITDLDFITLGGRLFRTDEGGHSIGTYFSSFLKELSPNTEVIILKDNYIPQGNMVLGVNSVFGGTSVDEEVAEDTPIEGVGIEDVGAEEFPE